MTENGVYNVTALNEHLVNLQMRTAIIKARLLVISTDSQRVEFAC